MEALLTAAFDAVYGSFEGAKINTHQCKRFKDRVQDSRASVMRAAASTSLTEAQSAALRKLLDLFHRAAEFMLQFGAKNFLRRMLSNSNDKEAMREFNERLTQHMIAIDSVELPAATAEAARPVRKALLVRADELCARVDRLSLMQQGEG